MKTAFKEWAVVCRALGVGRQVLILRKGGINEQAREFRPEHREFLLFPTGFHQSGDQLQHEALTLLTLELSGPMEESPKLLPSVVTHVASP